VRNIRKTLAHPHAKSIRKGRIANDGTRTAKKGTSDGRNNSGNVLAQRTKRKANHEYANG